MPEGSARAGAGSVRAEEWRRLAGLSIVFWSSAVLVLWPGRLLPGHALLLWGTGIAILWGGALGLTALRSGRGGAAARGGEALRPRGLLPQWAALAAALLLGLLAGLGLRAVS
jgi:hypothetical protein